MYQMSLAANLLLFALGLLGCVREFKREGFKITRYYTFDSNVLGMIAGGWMTAELIRNIMIGAEISQAAIIFKYTAMVTLSLTFFVVIFVLSPVTEGGYKFQLWYSNLKYQHTLCPLIAIISFIFMDPAGHISWEMFAMSLVPTLIYAIIIIILNVLKVLEGPYPFLYVYKQKWYVSMAWALGIIGVTAAYSVVVMFIKNVL